MDVLNENISKMNPNNINKFIFDEIYDENDIVDIVDVHPKLSPKYRYIKVKHFTRLLAIGNKIKEKMRSYNETKNGFTIKEIGDEYGCDYSLVSKVVNGHPSVPLKFLIGILDYMNYDLYLIVNLPNDNDLTLLLSQKTLKNKLERLGYAIKQERIKQGHTSVEFAKMLKISRPTLGKLEQGYSTASLYQYFITAEMLGIQIKIAINDREQKIK